MIRGLTSLAIVFVCVLLLTAIAGAYVFLTLPDVQQLKGCMTTEMYQVHLCETDPLFTPFSAISPYIVGAVIMSEDASFYSHQGVDIDEMKVSFKKDLNEMRFARGASTITQQLAKNVFLSKSKNLIRKLEEIYLALQIEKYFTKQKILTFYLNVVEFDDHIYGIKAATHHYFHKEPSEVTPEEAAFLIFLLPNPKKYSQSFHRGKLTPFAEKTIKTILHKMDLAHKLTPDEYAAAEARVSSFPWNSTSEQASPDLTNVQQPTSDMTDSPMGTTDAPPTKDENDSSDDEFNFDFKSE